MTALDSCEPQIIRALEKKGWRIFLKPHSIATDERPVFADFSVQHDAEGKIIVVIEVKCFANPKADLTELYMAIGQYQYYRVNMKRQRKSYPLYLAIPEEAYQRFLGKPSFIDTLTETQVKLVVIDTVKEVVLQWID